MQLTVAGNNEIPSLMFVSKHLLERALMNIIAEKDTFFPKIKEKFIISAYEPNPK